MRPVYRRLFGDQESFFALIMLLRLTIHAVGTHLLHYHINSSRRSTKSIHDFDFLFGKLIPFSYLTTILFINLNAEEYSQKLKFYKKNLFGMSSDHLSFQDYSFLFLQFFLSILYYQSLAKENTMGKWKKSSQKLIDQFYDTLEAFDAVEMRKMFGYPCSFLNGNMFTGLHEENWVLRLSELDIEEIKKQGAQPFVPMGRSMKEYVLIPALIKNNSIDLKGWIQRSLEFVSSLPLKLKNK